MKAVCAGLLGAALLAGCATTPAPVPGELPWTVGRLSLRVDAHGGDPARSLSAGFELRGSSEHGELNLDSALGTRLVQAGWSAAGVWLRTAQFEARYDSLDELSQQALGQTVPLAALPDWLAGRPWPAAPFVARPDGFEQLGWSVGLSGQSEGRIEAYRAAPPAIALRVKIHAAQP